jgi:hypothetical protein
LCCWPTTATSTLLLLPLHPAVLLLPTPCGIHLLLLLLLPLLLWPLLLPLPLPLLLLLPAPITSITPTRHTSSTTSRRCSNCLLWHPWELSYLRLFQNLKGLIKP